MDAAAGWRAEFLKVLNNKALNILEEVCELIIKEEELVPESVRPYFFGARLIAISKGENKGVRPIAIGTILRKATSSAIAINVKSRLPSFFGPCQCGVGMPGGAENVVHGVRMLLLEDNPGNVVVSLDLTNAFNPVSKAAFAGLIEEHFPELASLGLEVLWAKQLLLSKGQSLCSLCSWCPARRSTGSFPLLPCSASSPQEVGKECCSIGLHG